MMTYPGSDYQLRTGGAIGLDKNSLLSDTVCMYSITARLRKVPTTDNRLERRP